jgi:hypothetical protein
MTPTVSRLARGGVLVEHAPRAIGDPLGATCLEAPGALRGCTLLPLGADQSGLGGADSG